MILTDVTKSQTAKKKGARTKPTAQLLHLVPKMANEVRPCNETVETLTWLLHEAIAGRIAGIVYGAMMTGKRYTVDAVGEAYSDPIRGIGLAQCLVQEINSRLRAID